MIRDPGGPCDHVDEIQAPDYHLVQIKVQKGAVQHTIGCDSDLVQAENGQDGAVFECVQHGGSRLKRKPANKVVPSVKDGF